MKRSLVGLLLVLFVGVAAQAATYGIDKSAGKDSVVFGSQATLEYVEGKTNDIDGSFTIDPANTKAGTTAKLRVDLRTLKTGIGMRDQDMRNRNLQTDKYPYAYFVLTGVKDLPDKIESGQTYKATAQGWFYIHGVKRQLDAPIEVTRQSGSNGADVIQVRTEFFVKLSDYSISRPRALFLKLAEDIDVKCLFVGAQNVTGETFDVPDWPEAK